MKKKHIQRGFTLIELLVVIAIIGMLSSVVLASLNGARIKARDARRLADMRSLQVALELYVDENSQYPSTPTSNFVRNFGTTLSPYLEALPTDPRYGGGANDYKYNTSDRTVGYTVISYVEGLISSGPGWCRITVGNIVPTGWSGYPACSTL